MTGIAADSTRFTLDTNILIYSVGARDAVRRDAAAALVDGAVVANCVLTLQSLSEFYSVATRKQILSAGDAADLVRQWLSLFPAVPASPSAIRIALDYSVARRASYWDALLVATAAEAGCRLALTEDMANGSVFQGVEIHNPFTPAGSLTGRARALLGP